ncbi:hypothetical protein [Desulfoscipio sp. XC116]|uniref:hypothetical protein n=1 Tax=Desulfoscipio sp. XC116 TaxID=3144975 RepID=UPI00325AC542
MPDAGLEKSMVELLELKDKYHLDNDKLLLLVGLVNLMGIINLLEVRVAAGAEKSGAGRSALHQEMAPLWGMFGGPKGRQPVDGAAK